MSSLGTAFQIVLVVAVLVGASACDSPCVTLGHVICDCETSETAQQSCRQTVDDRSKDTDVSSADEKRCSELLDSCSCNKLADGNLAACGLDEPDES
ncbi:MAG: hypothetical protein AAB426_09590 [Myxococcota bacterium]